MDLKIKVCGMASVGNIEEVAQLSPDYMGFIFHEASPRNAFSLSTDVVKVISGDITPVGVFVNRTLDEIKSIGGKYGITTLQLHGNESPSLCEALKNSGYTVWKAIGVDAGLDWKNLNVYRDVIDRFVFDTKSQSHGGTGCKYDWGLLDSYTLDIPFFLSGGIAPDDVSLIAELVHPMFSGVDLNSRFEITPGVKNIISLRKFINELRNHE